MKKTIVGSYELTRLGGCPMSGFWDLAGERNGYVFYRSRSGRLVAKFESPDGVVWYKATLTKPPTTDARLPLPNWKG